MSKFSITSFSHPDHKDKSLVIVKESDVLIGQGFVAPESVVDSNKSQEAVIIASSIIPFCSPFQINLWFYFVFYLFAYYLAITSSSDIMPQDPSPPADLRNLASLIWCLKYDYSCFFTMSPLVFFSNYFFLITDCAPSDTPHVLSASLLGDKINKDVSTLNPDPA